MENKVFVVTGATSGIGKALAVGLAKTGQIVVIVARHAERGSATHQETEAAAHAYDRDAQQRLWEISEGLTGLSAAKGVTPVNDPRL